MTRKHPGQDIYFGGVVPHHENKHSFASINDIINHPSCVISAVSYSSVKGFVFTPLHI